MGVLVPRKSSAYGGDYPKLRARILDGGKRCAYCSNPANSTDHVPPVKFHAHKRVGCRVCHLVPSCLDCAHKQGGLISVGRWFADSVDNELADLVELLEPTGFDVLDPVWDKPWLDALRDVPASAVWPRLMTVPHVAAIGSHGEKFEKWCRTEFGVTLRWWQRLVAYRLLEHDKDERLVWRSLILTLARQLGKSTVLAAILMWRTIHGLEMFGEEQLLLHVARNTDAAREVQRPARTWAKREPWLFKVIEANGKEMIEHIETSSRWVARAEHAVYGFSATTVLADETWDIESATLAEGIEPTLVAHNQPQLLITSTAHRKATSLVLARRALAVAALDSSDDGGLLVEWSALSSARVDDRTSWRMASPHWDKDRERELTEKLSLAMAGDLFDSDEPDPVEFFRAQWLNIWPNMTRRGRGESLIEPDLWKSLRDPALDTVGALTVAVEDCFGRGASACAAGMSEDGRVVVGGWCFATRDEAYVWAKRWVLERDGAVLLVGSLLKDDAAVAEMPTQVESRGATDTRSALSLLRELVAAGRVVHDGSDVEAQIAGARVTPAPSGGLQLINSDRFDLVRCVAWAVAEAHRSEGLVPAVHGSSM